MSVTSFSGPCKASDNEPTRKDPLGPGIRSANNLLLLLLSDLSTTIITKSADNKIYIKYHMFGTFKSITYTHKHILNRI